MFVELTTKISEDCPILSWANAQENPYLAMGHVGTHLDCYEKTEIPLSYCVSEAVLFDVRAVEEITEKEVELERIHEEDFVLLRTGRMEQYGYGQPGYFHQHPQLSHELIQKLIERNIRFIGLDGPGIRRGDEHEQEDRLCEQHGIYVIENLSNLDRISGRMRVHTMWMEEAARTGLRCRVLAEIVPQPR